jgi:hypothetical protein
MERPLLTSGFLLVAEIWGGGGGGGRGHLHRPQWPPVPLRRVRLETKRTASTGQRRRGGGGAVEEGRGGGGRRGVERCFCVSCWRPTFLRVQHIHCAEGKIPYASSILPSVVGLSLRATSRDRKATSHGRRRRGRMRSGGCEFEPALGRRRPGDLGGEEGSVWAGCLGSIWAGMSSA